MWVVSPIQNLTTYTLDSAKNFVDRYLLVAEVSEENKKLKQEIDKLIRQNNELREELRQKGRVDALMEYQEERQLKSVVARVIGRDATQWARVVFINKGTQDGVKENLAVVTSAGIVGHVIQAGLNTSKVMLVVDGRSSVDALFSYDRVSGIVVGTGMEFCEMKYVPSLPKSMWGTRLFLLGWEVSTPRDWWWGPLSVSPRQLRDCFRRFPLLPAQISGAWKKSWFCCHEIRHDRWYFYSSFYFSVFSSDQSDELFFRGRRDAGSGADSGGVLRCSS